MGVVWMCLQKEPKPERWYMEGQGVQRWAQHIKTELQKSTSRVAGAMLSLAECVLMVG